MNIFFRSCLDYFDSIPLLNSDSENERKERRRRVMSVTQQRAKAELNLENFSKK